MTQDPELVELRRQYVENCKEIEQIKRERAELERINKEVSDEADKVYNDFQLGLITREDAKLKIEQLKQKLKTC